MASLGPKRQFLYHWPFISPHMDPTGLRLPPETVTEGLSLGPEKKTKHHLLLLFRLGSPVTFQLTALGLKGPLLHCPCALRQGRKSVPVNTPKGHKPGPLTLHSMARLKQWCAGSRDMGLLRWGQLMMAGA